MNKVYYILIISVLAAGSFLTGWKIKLNKAKINSQSINVYNTTVGSNSPNILFIITDQFNPNALGYAGNKVVKTPNLDHLAKNGIVFTRMYTSEPLCMPARATLITGLTPRGHKVRMNGIPLGQRIPTFSEALRRAGYQTHYVGKPHFQGSVNPTGESDEYIAKHFDPDVLQENGQLWRKGKIKKLKLPYYGFGSIDFLNGHGHNTYGDYYNWLKKKHPEAFKLFINKTSLTPKTRAADLYNRNSYKWALPDSLHPTTWIANKTISFLKKKAEQKKDKRPFFLMVSIPDPHPPFAPPAPYCDLYDTNKIADPVGFPPDFSKLPPYFKKMYDSALTTSGNKLDPMKASMPYRREIVVHYYGLITLVDDQIGRIMNTLMKTGLQKNTIVIFTADHGECLGNHGLWGKGPYHYDEVIRVPFIIYWPSGFQRNVRYEKPVQYIDIAPTILSMAGVPEPQGRIPLKPETEKALPPLPGKSLLPVCNGEGTLADTTALIEEDEDYLGMKLRTLVTPRYRITVYSGQDYGELYDFKTDPHETKNLWYDPEYCKIKEKLMLLMLKKIIETDISVPRQMSRA